MKIYKVAIIGTAESGSEHEGYAYVSNKADARKKARENELEALENMGLDYDSAIEELEVDLNKNSLLIFLNAHCAHPDNG